MTTPRFHAIGSTIIIYDGPEIVGNVQVPAPGPEVAQVFFGGTVASSARLAREVAAILNERFAPINSDNQLDSNPAPVSD